MQNRFKSAGFTLMELITTMAIAAILAGVAIPSFKYVTTKNRISSEVNSLLGDMQYARTESIKEGRTVSLCVSTDGATCLGGVATAWDSGWIVFSDVNGNGTLDGGTDTVLRNHPSFANSNSQDTFAGATGSVTFNREGFAAGLAASPTTFTLHDPTARPSYTRCLQLTPTGYLNTVSGGVAGCT